MNDATRSGPKPASARAPWFVCALALVFATTARPEPAPTPALAPASALASAPASAPARPTPLLAELVQLVEFEQAQLAEIRRALALTGDRMRRFELERRMEAVKLETELSLLRVQAVHARRENRVDAAEKLEAAIRQMSAPPARGVPIERPATAGVNR